MRWKLFTLITALLLVLTTSVTPIKVAAQSVDEPPIQGVIIVLGMANNETAEIIYWRPRLSPPSHTPVDRVFFNFNHFKVTSTSPPASPSDAVCSEAVQTTGNGRAGLNILTLEMGEGNESLLVNGKDIPLTEGCLMDAIRVVIQVSITSGDSRFKFSDNNSPFPAIFPVASSIYDSLTGATRATMDGIVGPQTWGPLNSQRPPG